MSFLNDNATFQQVLLRWYFKVKRTLPWRNSTDPYKIWLSEIILQQTRVAQGLPYYQEFTKKYPTVNDLARANETEVLRTWQGLGYYSRARNLHKCAIIVSDVLNGQFPDNYEDLLQLPGIGPYTAAAISSFAYNEPRAVVDGNVFRVLSRIFGIDMDIASSSGQRYFRELANELIDHQNPGEYNQAIMEFGALHCTPANPKCGECPFHIECYARKNNLQNRLPVKTKKSAVKKRYLNYAVYQDNQGLFMKPRTEKDIWQGLYDFPLVETSGPPNEKSILDSFHSIAGKDTVTKPDLISPAYKHLLSHQRLEARFFLFSTKTKPKFEDRSIRHFTPGQIHDLPKPVLISRYLNDYIF